MSVINVTASVGNAISEDDKKKIKEAVEQASNSMLRIEAEKDYLKDVRERMKDEFEIPPKMWNQLVRVYHKQNYGEVTETNEQFELLYESVVGTN